MFHLAKLTELPFSEVLTTASEFWASRVRAAVARWSTPFYLAAWEPIEDAILELQRIKSELPVKHWLSVKTQPFKPLLKRWADRGRGAEVVSEYELRAAIAEGFEPKNILVNGVAKHTWLSRCLVPNLNIHVDSLAEATPLGVWGRDLNWRLGVRLHVRDEFDPDETAFGGQFGMMSTDAGEALDILRGLGANVAGLHFHLRSNVDSAQSYGRALTEAAGFCKAAKFRPTYVDTGGGIPDPGVGPAVAPQYFTDLGRSVDSFAREVGGIDEVWMEHVRFVTGRSAVLVVRVCDVKERPDCRYLICDGGRTNHALVSDWEQHRLVVLPSRAGAATLTTVAGPTCMAFDKFGRFTLPSDVGVGDLLVWMNAGAYHIPWETRFSRGLCRVVWCPGGTELQLVRDEETFDSWWGQWL